MVSEAIQKPAVLRWLRRWWPALTGPLAMLLALLARGNPDWVERLYASAVYPVLVTLWGGLTSLLPFSLIELVICAMLLAVVFLVVCLLMPARFRKGRFWTYEPQTSLWRLGELLLKLLSCILCAFILLCGLNYYRPEFTSFSGLTVRDSSSLELAMLCAELTERANDLRTQMTEDENGVTVLSQGYYATAKEAKNAFGSLSEDYAELPRLPITPKPVANSWWMSYMQITGVFSPFTYEANVNVTAPDYSIPATMCHELAHTRGFMREDEANFIGYLACEKSDDPQVEYSGVMLALVHSINRLSAVDMALFDQVNLLIGDGVRRDFADNNAYWERHEGPVAEVSEAVNNTYLRANNQSDGTQSYGRMVDLLLADFRARHNLS